MSSKRSGCLTNQTRLIVSHFPLMWLCVSISSIRICTTKPDFVHKGTVFLAFIIISPQKTSDFLRFYVEMFNKSAICMSEIR